MKKVILYHPWLGFGDNLQFSPLPELYAKKGIKFYVSNRIKYRNNEVKKLVWEMNPYVEGESDEDPNIGWGLPYKEVGNVCCNWLIAHGFTPSSRIVNPKVYYTPIFREDFKDKVVCDISAFHCSKDYINLDKVVAKYIENDAIQLVSNYTNVLNELFPIYRVRDLFEYIDIIASAKKFWCLPSGPNALSAALNLKNTHCLLPNNNPIFSFKNWQHGYIFNGITYYDPEKFIMPERKPH